MGLFTSKKGADVSRKSKRPSDDQGDQTGPDDQPQQEDPQDDPQLPETDLAQSTDPRGAESAAPDSTPLNPTPDPVAATEGSDSPDHVPTPDESGGAAPRELIEPADKSVGEQLEGARADSQRTKMQAYLVHNGQIEPDQVEHVTDEDLARLYEASIGGLKSLGDPSQVASLGVQYQQVQLAGNRAQKQALVVQQANLLEEHVRALSEEDLTAQVQAIVDTQLAREAEAAQAAALAVRPEGETPFAGDPPRYYMVSRGGGTRFAHEGQLIEIKDGQILSDRSHDIERIKLNGAKLHELAEPPEPTYL